MEVVVQDILCSHNEVRVAMTAVQKIPPLNKAHDLGGSFSAVHQNTLNCLFLCGQTSHSGRTRIKNLAIIQRCEILRAWR